MDGSKKSSSGLFEPKVSGEERTVFSKTNYPINFMLKTRRKEREKGSGGGGGTS